MTHKSLQRIFAAMRLLAKLVVLGLGAVLSADELLPWGVIVEPDTSGNFGWSIAAGDFDGSGAVDIAVGAPMANLSSGAVYIYFDGEITSPGLVIYGLSPGDQLGIALDCAGDVNGDGYDDLLAGANVVDDIGAAYVFFGGPSLDEIPDVALGGENPFDNFGYSVAGIGDLNGDGYDDLAVGALYNDCLGWRTGKVYIYFGGDDTLPDVTVCGLDSLDDFGTDIDGGFDFDGDGVPDLLVGAVQAGAYWLKPGAAYVLTGERTLLGITVPEFSFTGEFPMDFFGGSVAATGDVNGDGYDDALCGAYNFRIADSTYGRAYVYLGKPGTSSPFEVPDLVITGRCDGDALGGSVGAPGDVNGDGYDDIAVSANYDPESGEFRGQVLIFCGGFEPDSVVDYFCRGEFDGQNFGWTIEPLGDFTGDGHPDFAVGAPEFHGRGKVYIYAGFSSVSPVVAELISPFPGAVTSDSTQKVKFALHTERIIDPATAVVLVNGDTATAEIIADTLIYTPTAPFADGDSVEVCLVDVRTTAGDPLSEPVCTDFLVDLTPPVPLLSVPGDGDTVNFSRGVCAWVFIDSTSGRISPAATASVGDSALPVCVDTAGDFAVFWTSAELAPQLAPARPSTLCIDGVRDDPDYGAPNRAERVCVEVVFMRRWYAELSFAAEGRRSRVLVIGQAPGASPCYDPTLDLLWLPQPEKVDVRIWTCGTWLVRDFAPELAESLVWCIVNCDSVAVEASWDPAALPDGAVLVRGTIDMKAQSHATVAPAETIIISATFGAPKEFNLRTRRGWNLLGFPGYPAFGRIPTVTELGVFGFFAYGEHGFFCLRSWIGGRGFFALSTCALPIPVWYYSTTSQCHALGGGWWLISPPTDGGAITSAPADAYIPPPFALEGEAYAPADHLQRGRGYWVLLGEDALLYVGE